MRMTWKARLAVAVAGGWFAACGGNAEDPAAEIRPAQAARDTRTIALSGCLETAAGTSQYVLRNVRLAPLAEQPSDTATAQGAITEGSWAKLRTVDEEPRLDEHVGQLVTVVGRITDSGRNTIGTSGPDSGPDDRQPRKDASRAAANESYPDKVAKEAGPIAQQSLANGAAPEVTVERLDASGQRCPGR